MYRKCKNTQPVRSGCDYYHVFKRGNVQHQKASNFHLIVNNMLDFGVNYTSVKWHHPAVLGIHSNISSIQNDFERNFATLQTGQKVRKSQEISVVKLLEQTSYEEFVIRKVSNDTFGGSSVNPEGMGEWDPDSTPLYLALVFYSYSPRHIQFLYTMCAPCTCTMLLGSENLLLFISAWIYL